MIPPVPSELPLGAPADRALSSRSNLPRAGRREGEVQRLRELFDQAPGCMIVFVGPDHVVEMANPAYLAFTGLTADIIGHPARIGLKRGYSLGFGALLDSVYASGASRVARNARLMVNRTPGGPDEEAFADFVIAPLRDASGAIYGVFCQGHEVTLQKLAEDRLRQAQKMEAIGRLSGGIAHDFNNLLGVIIGSTESLAVALADAPKLRGLANVALDAAERGSGLVRRLLAFARSQPLAPRTIDCGAFLRDLAPILQRTLSKAIEIDFEIPEPPVFCLADHAQLTSALLNLCINARDAMPAGGRITVAVASEDCAAAGAPAYVVFSVRDTGEGMTAETHARALEPFFTTKPEGKGSGLGLSMVHGFATQSGGRVEINSQPGRGAQVRIFLPQTAAPAGAPAQPAAALTTG
ncbi:MAG: two-component system sensor histidine kinase NtrB [Phenylobacterium sp.]